MNKYTKYFSLIEVMIVSSVLAIAMLSAMLFTTNQDMFSRIGHEQKFGYEKAIQILNELKTYQETTNSAGDLVYLDDLGDGSSTSPILTAQVGVTDPQNPLSGNVLTGSDPTNPTHWKYARRIHVIKSSEDSNSKDMRKVGVQIFLTAPGKADNILLSEVWSVIQTAADPGFPPTQVFDLYAIAIENVPGWWVFMSNLIPQVENAIKDLEGRNNGMDFRVHWITKMGYGRNPFYMPMFNLATDSVATPYNTPYFYPSLMPNGSATSEYYVPRLVHAYYRDETNAPINDYNATDNPAPYTIADSYNQSNTYPLLLEQYNLRLSNNPDEEMPYALLLDDMHLHPEKYKNALFINLHGELLPIPAIRNYADAAKHPQLSDLVSGDINRIVAETSHSVTRQALTPTDTTVSVTQLQNLADDADFALNDTVRIDNEICTITAIDTATKTLTLTRGAYGTTATAHKILAPILHQPLLQTNLNTVDTVIPITSSKGLTIGEKLSIVKIGVGPVLLGTISNLTATHVTLSSRLDGGQSWLMSSPLICSSAVPTLASTINAGDTSITYHNGGASSPISTNDTLNIGGEIIHQNAGSVTRGLYNTSAVTHYLSEAVGHINFVEGVRIVTHPENSRYNVDTNPAFRVYAWLSDSAPDSTKPKRLSTIPVTLLFKLKDISLDDTTAPDWIDLRTRIIASLTSLGITRIEGGVKPASSRYDNNVTALTYPTAPTNDALTADDDEMYARIDPVFIRTSADGVTPVTGYISIAVRLYNTPLTTPYLGNRGLHSSAQLYGLEYLPTPFGGNFNTNLTTTGTARKNTARWIVPFPAINTILGYLPAALSTADIDTLFSPLKVETRIGDINLKPQTYGSISVNEIIPGIRYGEITNIENFKSPLAWLYRTENFSQTHTWGHSLYDSGGSFISLADDTHMAFSDKYQFMGDPRYEPCADVLSAGHHNTFFTNEGINASEGMGTTYKGWGPDDNEVDVPRMMQMVREAIMQTNSIFTTINGYSYYYIGTGGEIGYDGANGFSKSIPVNGAPYHQSGSGWAQHIIHDSVGSPQMGGYGLAMVRDASGWCCAPTIGELYKDEDVTSWRTGGALTNYYRVNKASDGAVPSAQRYYSGRRCQTTGCKSFYNVRSSSGWTFDHDFWTSNATILPTIHNSDNIKDDFESTFNMVMPTTITSNRPWRINDTGSGGEEWWQASYVSQRTNAKILQVFYEHNAAYKTSDGEPVRGIASGLMQCYDPNNTNRLGYFAVHGIAQTAEIGSVFIGRYAIMSLLYSYLRASSTDNTLSPTKQSPLIEITAPTDMTSLINPGVVSIQWNLQWKRWDKEKYTKIGTYNTNLAPGDDGFFKVGYSSDNRETWKYVNTNLTYTPGKANDIGLEITSDITAPPGAPSQGYFVSAEPDDPAPKTRWNYAMAWDLTGFPKGTYYIRIEYHRKDPATGIYMPTHYSHHMMSITIED